MASTSDGEYKMGNLVGWVSYCTFSNYPYLSLVPTLKHDNLLLFSTILGSNRSAMAILSRHFNSLPDFGKNVVLLCDFPWVHLSLNPPLKYSDIFTLINNSSRSSVAKQPSSARNFYSFYYIRWYISYIFSLVLIPTLKYYHIFTLINNSSRSSVAKQPSSALSFFSFCYIRWYLSYILSLVYSNMVLVCGSLILLGLFIGFPLLIFSSNLACVVKIIDAVCGCNGIYVAWYPLLACNSVQLRVV